MKKIINPYAGTSEELGYNCFACAPENPFGLKMEFYEDGDEVVCFWAPSENYQGWLQTLHGGIAATLMDETGGWLVFRKFQTSAEAVYYKFPKEMAEKEFHFLPYEVEE